MAKIQEGEILELFDEKWIVQETELGRSDCNECEAHYLCAHNYPTLRRVCAMHGCSCCTELIGLGFNLRKK